MVLSPSHLTNDINYLKSHGKTVLLSIALDKVVAASNFNPLAFASSACMVMRSKELMLSMRLLPSNLPVTPWDLP